MGLFDKMFPPQKKQTDTKKATSKKAQSKTTVKKAAPKTANNGKKETNFKAEQKAVTKGTSSVQKAAPKPTAKKEEKALPKKTSSPVKAEKTAPKKAAPTKIEAKTAVIDTEPKKRRSKPGHFEIKHAKDGRFVFNLYASNGEIIATSQTYTSATAAMAGTNSVIANASLAGIEDQTVQTVQVIPFPKWEIYLDKSGEYRFRLNATNGYTVCHSQGYSSKAACRKGIESVRRTVLTAKLDKAYLEED